MNPNTPTNTSSTARSLSASDYQLWYRPAYGTPFLLDWGTEMAMKQKLADMVIVAPEKKHDSPP